MYPQILLRIGLVLFHRTRTIVAVRLEFIAIVVRSVTISPPSILHSWLLGGGGGGNNNIFQCRRGRGCGGASKLAAAALLGLVIGKSPDSSQRF